MGEAKDAVHPLFFVVGDTVEQEQGQGTVFATRRTGKVVGVIRGEAMDAVAVQWEQQEPVVFAGLNPVDLQFVIHGMDVHTIRKVEP